MRRRLLIGLVCAAASVAACGSGNTDSASVESADGGTDTGAESATTSPSSRYDAGHAKPTSSDSGSDGFADGGCVPGEGGSSDVPDDDGADTNCDGADGVVGRDVYVDPVGGADTGDGTPSSPLRTIDAAVVMAAPRSGSVLVAAGKVALSKIDQVGAVAIYGGYATVAGASPTFTGKPDRVLTILIPVLA